jgi:hypothetical protein
MAQKEQIFLIVMGTGFCIMWVSGLHLFLPATGKELTGFVRLYIFLVPQVFTWLMIATVLLIVKLNSRNIK